MSPKFTIRKATRSDSKSFLKLISAFAKFEDKEPPDEKARNRIIRDIFEKKLARLLVAASGRKLIGYALYFYTYSSFTARPTLYLEDLFVLEDTRRRGLGKALFTKCVEEAINHGCNKMEWAVLPWNRNAIDFYEKLGAKKLDLLAYELDLSALKSGLDFSRE